MLIKHRLRSALIQLIALTGVMTFFAASAISAEQISWVFENGVDSFTVGSSSLTMSEAPSSEFTDSAKSLRIRGNFSGGNTYLTSVPQPLLGFNQYRITASMKIDRYITSEQSQSKTPSLPCVRLEFLTADSAGVLGTIEIGPDSHASTAWQLLTEEFRAPWGTELCRIVIADKGNSSTNTKISAELDFSLDKITIEQIPFFTKDYAVAVKPLPESMNNSHGKHPRLYLTPDKIDALRSSIQSTHKEHWLTLKTQADGLLTRNPPEWRGNDEGQFDEQWWMSGNGRSMITLAMAYLMTDDESYLHAAENWARVTCAYPGWGIGWAADIDCMTGHNLYGLALVYDWLYDSMDKDTRATIKKALVYHAAYMYDSASKGSIVPGVDYFRERPWPEWEEAWLQNHLWVNSTGLLSAGLALYDETDEALQWIGFAQDKFVRTMDYLGPDGASHEGINYWSYGLEALLKSMHLLRENLGVDLYGSPWFAETSRFRIYASIPRDDWKRGSTTINFSDSHPRDNSGPGHMLRALAHEYRDSHAQYFANAIDNSGASNLGDSWLNLIWYDPSVPETAMETLPTLWHFDDMDFVSARSGWAGDESFLYYKCGPYLGHHASSVMNFDTSSAHHLHPDQNSFMLHGAGEWLIRDDGNMGKYTGQHNTLIIDDAEQLGGGDSIFDGITLHAEKRTPHILRAESSADFDHIAGDAAEAYPTDTGLKRFTRHLLYLKPDILIVADDIALDSAHDLELRFHPGPQEATREGDAFFTRTDKSTLRIEPLTPDGIDMKAVKHDLIDRRYNKSEMLSVNLKKHAASWRNAVALSWMEKGFEPATVTVVKDGDSWTFSAGGKTVILNWESGTAEYRK